MGEGKFWMGLSLYKKRLASPLLMKTQPVRTKDLAQMCSIDN